MTACFIWLGKDFTVVGEELLIGSDGITLWGNEFWMCQ